MEILSSRVLLRPQDLERSLRFYKDTLGLAVYREWGEGKTRGVAFFLGGGLLEVSSTSPEPPSDAVRLFLQVRDLHAVRGRLAERGIPIEKEPEVKPWGPARWSRAIPTASPWSSLGCRPSTRSDDASSPGDLERANWPLGGLRSAAPAFAPPSTARRPGKRRRWHDLSPQAVRADEKTR